MATWNGRKLFEHLGVPYIKSMPRARSHQPRGCQWGDDSVRYTWGQCHALALAILQKRPEWTLYGVGWEGFYDEDDEIIREPGHVLVSPEEGEVFLDVEGLWYAGEEPVYDAAPLSFGLLQRMVHDQDYAMPVLDEHTIGIAEELIRDYEGGLL